MSRDKRISEDGVTFIIYYHYRYSIKCKLCNKESHNENDVHERYCGNCHQYHSILEYLVKNNLWDYKNNRMKDEAQSTS